MGSLSILTLEVILHLSVSEVCNLLFILAPAHTVPNQVQLNRSTSNGCVIIS